MQVEYNVCRADLYISKQRLEKADKQVTIETAKALSQQKLAAHFKEAVKEKEEELREELQKVDDVRE